MTVKNGKKNVNESYDIEVMTQSWEKNKTKQNKTGRWKAQCITLGEND